MGEPGAGRAPVDLHRLGLQQRWSRLHHGIDPSRVPLLPGWLRLMWRVATPLAARGVPPTALTALGVAAAGGAVVSSRRRPLLGLALVPTAAICDGLDGAVAVVADRASAVGGRADAFADRAVDAAFAAVLWRCGASGRAALAAAAVAIGVDVVRRTRRVPTRITVAERPTWTICATLACASAAATDARWPVQCCTAVWLTLGGVGLGQVARG